MSEVLSSASSTLDKYQSEVESTRRVEFDENWRDIYADLIQGEALEFYFQHGPSLFYLMPKEFDEALDKQEVNKERPEISEGMTEELGDLLWFGFSTSTRIGKQAKDLCAKALERTANTKIGSINTFYELQNLVLANAPQIKVPTEFALSGYANPEDDEELLYVDLEDDPFYVSQRMFNRLIRSLQEGKKDVSPPTASVMEPIAPLGHALGDFINTVIYLCKNRVGVDVEEVARRNIEKLKLRETLAKR